MAKAVAGQRVRLLTYDGKPGLIARAQDSFYTMTVSGESGLFLVHERDIQPMEAPWRGRLRHALWRARFGLHLLHEALIDYWRPPWRKPASGDPWDNIDLRTALEVAWAIWR